MAMLQDKLTVSDPQFSDPTVRDKFKVEIEPVDRKRTDQTRHAKQRRARDRHRASRASRRPVPSWLTLHTNLPEAEKLEIPVLGRWSATSACAASRVE